MHDEENYVVHMKALKQALSHGLIFKYQSTMNNAVFGKTMENVRKHRDIKSVTTPKRVNQLESEPNYHATKKL